MLIPPFKKIPPNETFPKKNVEYVDSSFRWRIKICTFDVHCFRQPNWTKIVLNQPHWITTQPAACHEEVELLQLPKCWKTTGSSLPNINPLMWDTENKNNAVPMYVEDCLWHFLIGGEIEMGWLRHLASLPV
jgi:hypothetical protein